MIKLMAIRTNEHKRNVVERYLSGESSSALEKETGTGAALILQWVRKFGGQVRTQRRTDLSFVNFIGDFVKICAVCGREKIVEDFTRYSGHVDGYSKECRECRRKERKKKYPEESSKSAESQRKKRQSDPKRFRGYDMKKRFGLDWNAFETLFDSQDRKCAGCRSTESGEKSGSWHIDHDHSCCDNQKGKTCGKCVRGILCRWCNLALGNAKEDSGRLRGLADYVESYKTSKLPSGTSWK